MNSLLITRPNHDLPTKYLYAWAGEVLKTAKKSKLKYTDLKGKKANLKNFTKALKQKPGFIFLNGHGSRTEITGYDNSPMLETGKNEELAKGTLVYAVSCQAGAKLGPAMVKAGAKAFIGYKEDFFLCYTAKQVKKPLKDNTAKLFLEPSNLVPTALIQQKTAKSAYESSQQAMQENISFMLSSKATKTQRDAAPYLYSNLNCQTLLVDKKTKINP